MRILRVIQLIGLVLFIGVVAVSCSGQESLQVNPQPASATPGISGTESMSEPTLEPQQGFNIQLLYTSVGYTPNYWKISAADERTQHFKGMDQIVMDSC